MSVISVAMTGMRAASARLEVSAENLAHQNQRAPPPGVEAAPATRPATTPLPKVYRPVRANLYSLAQSDGGGVAVQYRQVAPGYFTVYEPAAAEADNEGMVAMPDVDPASERLEQIQAVVHYRTSLELAKAADEMQDAAVDLLA